MAADCVDKDVIIDSQRRQIQSLQIESETLRQERDELLARLCELSALLEKSRERRTNCSPASPPVVGGEREAADERTQSEFAISDETRCTTAKGTSGKGRLSGSEVFRNAAAIAWTPTVCVSPSDTVTKMSEASCKKRPMGHSSTMPALMSKCRPPVGSSTQCSNPRSSDRHAPAATHDVHDGSGSSSNLRTSTHLPLPPAAYRGAPFFQHQAIISGDFYASSYVPAAGEQACTRWPRAAGCEAVHRDELATAVRNGQLPDEQTGVSGHRLRVQHRSAAGLSNGATSFEEAHPPSPPSAATAGSRSRAGGRTVVSTATACDIPTASVDVAVPADVEADDDDADAVTAAATAAAATCDDVLSPPSPYNSSTTTSDDSSDDELPASSRDAAAAGQASATSAAAAAAGAGAIASVACSRGGGPPAKLIHDGSGTTSPRTLPSGFRVQTRGRRSSGGAAARQRRGSGWASAGVVDDGSRREELYPESPAHLLPTSSSHGCIRDDLMQSAGAVAAAGSDAPWVAGAAPLLQHRRRSSAPSHWSSAAFHSSAGSMAPSDPQRFDDWLPRTRPHRRSADSGGGGSATSRQHRGQRLHRRYQQQQQQQQQQRLHQVSYCRYCSSSGGSCRHSSSAASAEVDEICAGERRAGDGGGDTDEVEADSSDSSSRGSDDEDVRADDLGGQEDLDRGGLGETESYRRAGSVGANRLAEIFVVVQPTRTGALACERERKRQYRIGLNLFNRKPELGVRYLMEHRFLENSAQAVAHFLLNRKGLSRQVIGDYLGNLQQAFNQEVLRYFVQEVDIVDLELDEALRKFVSLFQLPGEAQKIERIMEMFAQHYCLCNPDVVKNFKSSDMVFLITFSIIMLNTDLHNPNIKSHRRMKVDNFIANVKGIDGGDDLSPQFLRAIYSRIRDNELRTGVDHTTQVRKVEETMVGKCPVLSVPWRRLVCYCRLYEVRNAQKRAKPGSHQREVFLFNDVLVVTKIFAKKKGCITYSFRESLDLSDLLVSPFETECYQFGIHLLSKSDHRLLLLFNARNEHDREKFVEDVGESIREVCETDTLLAREELRRTTSLGKFSKDSGCVADVEFTKACVTSAVGRHEDATSSVIDCVSAVTLSSERLHCNSLTDLSCNGVATT